MLIIPGSMGSDSFHVEGKGNWDALCSSSHVAGRSMSRQRAKKSISVDSLTTQMQGIYYQDHKRQALTEEAPKSYKNIHQVMKAQKDLIKIKRKLSPVLNYKGA